MINLERDPICGEVKDKFHRLGIEAVLFDLDDTLIYTSEIFIQCMREYAILVSEKIGVETDEMLEILQSVNDKEYKRMGVNPNRWVSVVEKMAQKFEGGEKEILDNLNVLTRIYSIEPRIREGVRGILETLNKIEIKMVLVTHANVEWTNFKMDRLGLWDYFEAIVIADEDGQKRSEDWKRGMDSINTDPGRCLVVGDSLGGDIKPGDALGARTIYLPSPWSVYREGEVPERTVVIDEIAEMLAALDKLR